jgi:uncharacterized protein (DUF58 family)
MTGWRPTAALGRALVLGSFGLALALAAGEPALVVLCAPFVVLSALALVHRPSAAPGVAARVDHRSLQEGQGTTSRLTLTDAEDVEYVARSAARPPYLLLRPSLGQVGRLLPRPLDIEVGAQRWGRRMVGEEKVALYTPWAGFRFGPVHLAAEPLRVLPGSAPYDSRAEAPQPLGLVGANRSRRPGSGSELSGIRPFQAGDRLRRINWRVSLRTGDLHVVSTRAEEDTGVLLVLDSIADHGVSAGVTGAASSMDLTVRAAAAIAEHHVRRGDRVALRALGRGGEHVTYGAGARHLRRLQDRLAVLRVGAAPDAESLSDSRSLGVTGGAVVVVLSPMLAPSVGTIAASLTRRGVSVLVVDTLPPDAAPAVGEDVDPKVAALAWRMRLLERSVVLDGLARLGCPVVPWRGPGTLDEVLRRLARRAQQPRVVTR